MMCLKCGNEIKDNEQICSNCGWNKNSKPNNDNKFATNNIGVLNTNPIDKEKVEERLEHQKQFQDLIETYIGSMYYNFKKGSFSWCAFFFGPLYIAYRKMIGVSIIVYIINILITLVFMHNYILQLVASLIFNIFLGISFKKIYYEDCVEKVGKIKQNNPDKGFNELTEIAKTKGGVNILYPILILISMSIILSIAMLIFNIGYQEIDMITKIQRLISKY